MLRGTVAPLCPSWLQQVSWWRQRPVQSVAKLGSFTLLLLGRNPTFGVRACRTRLRTSRAKRRCCNTKRTWHFYCPLAMKLPKMLPGLLLQVLYHFAQRRAIECAAFETDLHRNTIAACCDTLRPLVVNFMDQVSTNQKRVGWSPLRPQKNREGPHDHHREQDGGHL